VELELSEIKICKPHFVMGPKRVLVNLRKAREAKRLKRTANMNIANSQFDESVRQPILGVDLTIDIEPVEEVVMIESNSEEEPEADSIEEEAEVDSWIELVLMICS
jgi:hypothetical protein